MENLNIVIGTNIRNLRKLNGLTQEELAKKINYSNKAISRWESGEVIPDVETINNMCEVFNVPISTMFEENIAPKEVDSVCKHRKRNKFAISLLAVMLVWLIAIVCYVSINISLKVNAWVIFIWAVPVSCVVGIVFTSIWGKMWFNFILISLEIWTLLASIYITFNKYHLWMIFFIGIPMQVAVFLWSNIHKSGKYLMKKKEKKEEQNAAKEETPNS